MVAYSFSNFNHEDVVQLSFWFDKVREGLCFSMMKRKIRPKNEKGTEWTSILKFAQGRSVQASDFSFFFWVEQNHKALTLWSVLVEISGIEPLTSWMPFKRSPSWAIAPHLSKAAMKQSVVLEVISVRAILLRPQKAFFASLVRKIFVMQGPSWKTNFFLAYLLRSCCFIHIVWSNFCIFCQHLFHLHKVSKCFIFILAQSGSFVICWNNL